MDIFLIPQLTSFLTFFKFIEFLAEKLFSPSPDKAPMDTSGIVLVAGATGGVGRRVVDILRKKGLRVRVLVFSYTLLVCFQSASQKPASLLYSSWGKKNDAIALSIMFLRNFIRVTTSFLLIILYIWNVSQVRNEEKARKMLGSDIDLVSSYYWIFNFLD